MHKGRDWWNFKGKLQAKYKFTSVCRTVHANFSSDICFFNRAYVHEILLKVVSKWNYLMRTIPGISDLLLSLDEVINTHFILALTRRGSVNDLERQLLALPTRLGGLGIAKPSKIAPFEHSSSIKVPSKALRSP